MKPITARPNYSKRTASGISAQVPDWSREAKAFFEWAPGRSLLAAIRSYQRHQAGRGPVAALGRRIAALRHIFWSVVTGADIPVTCRIGGGLRIPHPNGIVVHSDAVLGPNCQIMQNATIGARGPLGLPVIGGHVDIGAGAVVLGPITIGDHAAIGATALVVSDVPAGAVVLAPVAQICTEDQAD